MRAVDIGELKLHLGEYLRLVRDGDGVLVTEQGRVIAELRRPARASIAPALLDAAAHGRVRLGEGNHPELYPALRAALPSGSAARLLDDDRSQR